ncbi:hypothetical protein [Microbacterium sp. SORGH_AS_0888]|uniref:hypothetical protein n=1 Tax=Microbacterium sp. SORGH_AS_0888 TaxID=3041791 RepID=UPI002785D826|nr:hypothetical protein [Microbacterium sp. SORGH_AS_0888]MDQ1130671.1 acyl-CoA reductase-like NAD-dependent aldehyde dehydrogenase [Microbacterium sp. SORGH_AS_0888]MDQ1130672.1 acyl-CoA reductase-like NAD-dependent aldehyde dehydrogenase [Microbacterium sp. SORGH_AS_0888]MDQ1130673.1 acyl-CoA reductase-like NAD-dependent aldehyde dehydrogenase [Microbacterium sp. SORGH_AS_0888]
MSIYNTLGFEDPETGAQVFQRAADAAAERKRHAAALIQAEHDRKAAIQQAGADIFTQLLNQNGTNE